eukprot:13518079-Heterocapsa_arctica.AAC.1
MRLHIRQWYVSTGVENLLDKLYTTMRKRETSWILVLCSMATRVGFRSSKDVQHNVYVEGDTTYMGI